MRRLLLCVVLVGCKDKLMNMPPPDMPHCGDDIIDAQIGEECEGSDFGGATCMSLGFDTGSLSCDAQCHLVKTLCVKNCGNGKKDTGEECDGDAGVPGCMDWGFVACTADCKLDHTHCVTTPFQSAAGALNLTNGGPATLGDLVPTGLEDLIVCEQLPDPRVATYPYSVVMGFQKGVGDSRMLHFGEDPVFAIGLGQDIVALNADGSLDRYAYNGSAFTYSPYPDAGCSGSIVGAISSFQVATQSCDGGELFVWSPALLLRSSANGGQMSIADLDLDGKPDVLSLNGQQLDVHLAPGFTASDAGTLPAAVTSLVAGDFDGDGDQDLAGLTPNGVKLFENTGGGAWADKMTLSATSPVNLRAADLDLDGRVDLVWESGDHAEVRRNQGDWVFAPFTAAFAQGPNVTFALGDVDGDGDLDLVSTRSAGGGATSTYVEINRVRQ